MTTFYTFISEQCKNDAQAHSLLVNIDKVAKNIEKQQSIDNLDPFGIHFVKKGFGKSFRLMIHKFYDENEDCLLVFWRIYPRSDNAYITFKDNYDLNLSEFNSEYPSKELNDILKKKQKSIDRKVLLSELSKDEKNFLFQRVSNKHHYKNDQFILESDEWINRVNRDASQKKNFHAHLGELNDVIISAVETDREISRTFSNDGDIGILCEKKIKCIISNFPDTYE